MDGTLTFLPGVHSSNTNTSLRLGEMPAPSIEGISNPTGSKVECFLPRWGWSHLEPGGAEVLGLERHTRHGHRSVCQWQ